MSLRIQKGGHDISTLDEWFRFAPPKKGLRHWVDGRSAKELAKAFLQSGIPAVPPELRVLLSSHQDLGMVDLTVAFPEHQIALDRFPGETRNADLAAVGNGSAGKVAITIEAKADEPFGDTIGNALTIASAKSNVPKRIAALAKAVFGHVDSEMNILRYQLLHGTAASLIFAKEQRATVAVFIVLEFRGPSCIKDNLERNSRDFALFLKMLSPSTPTPSIGSLGGPFSVRGGDFVPSGLPLYVGKAVRTVFPDAHGTSSR